MYQVKHKKNNYIELINSINKSTAKIHLKMGGALQKLVLDNTTIIKEESEIDAKNRYASSILFPFTGRLKNGLYKFEENTYQLAINDKERNNALHGLIYDKEFELITEEVTEDVASVKLKYVEKKKNAGFPYIFKVILTYTLSSDSLILEVRVVNEDENPFPFSLGWHPYFFSSDLYNTNLNFESDKKIVFDDFMIPEKTEPITLDSNFQIKDKKLDNCFELTRNSINIKTSDYCLQLDASSKENYLQLYVPADRNDIIAIEPMTAPADSFNNKLGIKVLKPKEEYTIKWIIKKT